MDPPAVIGNNLVLPTQPLDEKCTLYYVNAKEMNDDKKPCSVITKDSGGRLIPSRYICVLLGFLSCFILTAQRLNLSMALVAMVNQTAVYQSSGSNSTESECPIIITVQSDDSVQPKEGGTLIWDSRTQNNVVSAAFLGFFLTQTPGGRLSENLGGKQVLIFSLMVASLCNIFSPLVSNWGAHAFMGIHFIKGLSQGLTQPALTCLMARWYPTPEKGFLSSVTFAGYPAGAVVGGILVGALCDSGILGGWPMVFYLFGFLGVILCFMVFQLTFNTPEQDSKISEAEYKYICSNVDASDSTQKLKTPWKPIFTTPGTWALFLGMLGQYWSQFFFLSVYSTYLGAILHFTYIESGYLNSFPYIGQIITTSSASYLSDVLVNKGYSSIDTMRKVCNTLSCIGFSISLIGVVYAGCDKMLVSLFFVIAITSVGFGYAGACIVPLDMTVNFAGTMMGMVTTFASTAGFVIPLIVGGVTGTEQTLAKWSIPFYISAVIVMLSGVVFAIFGSAKLQKWDSTTPIERKVTGLVNAAFDGQPDETLAENSEKNYDISGVTVVRL